MSRLLRLIVLLAVGLLLLAAIGGVALYRAARHVPQFYREAIQASPATQHQASDHMLQRSAALASDLKRGGRWNALFTAEEINGWLAIDLVRNHAGSLPQGIEGPRVAMETGHVRVACRYHLGIIESVLWLEVEPYLTGRNAVAIRLRKLRAGRLPLPMQTVLEMIDQSVRNADLRIEWSQLGGDPVASISLPPQRDPAGNEFTLDTLRISEGKLIVAGTSKKK